MFNTVVTKVFGSKHERDVKKLQPRVAQINALEPQIKALSDEALRAKTAEFRAQLADGTALDDLLVPAFAVVREAAWRYDNGMDCAEAANTAKYLASEAAFFAADRAMQTHGGFGYAEEYHVGRYWREARLMKIAPVSQEMVLNFVSTKVLGLPRSY